jgi:hypothetical protein
MNYFKYAFLAFTLFSCRAYSILNADKFWERECDKHCLDRRKEREALQAKQAAQAAQRSESAKQAKLLALRGKRAACPANPAPLSLNLWGELEFRRQ